MLNREEQTAKYIDLMNSAIKKQQVASNYAAFMLRHIEERNLAAQYVDVMQRAIAVQNAKTYYIALMERRIQEAQLKAHYIEIMENAINKKLNERQKEPKLSLKSIRQQIEECQEKLAKLFWMERLEGEASQA